MYIYKVRRFFATVALLITLSMVIVPFAQADGPVSPTADKASEDPATSHRLIVELESPPLATWYQTNRLAQAADGSLNPHSSSAQTYIAQLQAEQASFVEVMQSTLPGAEVSTYINEVGFQETNAYQVVFNGLTVDPGEVDQDAARRILARLPGVKHVYLDYARTTDLYTSTQLIDAPAMWNSAAIGGRENAGAGIKFASMDGGVHHEAPMFDGTGYTYPAGYPKGYKENTNGKIIVSRAYFRPWDPPAAGDDNPWPGVAGTSHGVHTAGIAAGDVVTASYLGLEFPNMSGVAPKAYVMSYRVFYSSVAGIGSFYDAEGIAALEDIILDGAEVLNNSWGGGPSSAGGEFDALDTALTNVVEAGIFVAMSAGNAGPGLGTVDHPSTPYISVAASTTSGTLLAGVLNITEPEPISDTLQGISFGTAEFGDPILPGQILTYTFKTAVSVDATNFDGCDPFPANAFDGYAAVISRGSCNFSDKVYHAEQAGAEFVVIYNNDGDSIINMACASHCAPGEINISSIFIGQTYGDAMVDWYADHGSASVLEVDTFAFQAGNEPDVVAGFSSRGPGVGYTLKPDVAAPGVNILSQGYAPLATGEARHLGFGQASGTSMAAPHVAGAAALLKQIHPDWPTWYIKSALMSTAKYLDVYADFQGTPAQPLDMGAGRIDLQAALDPGVILDPPSLSFGNIMTGTSDQIVVEAMDVSGATEVYTLTTLYTGAGFAPTQTTTLPGFTVEPMTITVPADGTAVFTVTFDSTMGMGIGDNQGYIVMEGEMHDAHLPAWARVQAPPATADVLLIDSDFSFLLGYPDYLTYYTDALDALGLTYDIWDADTYFANPTTIPDEAILSAYDTIILFTGDHWQPDGTYSVSTPFTDLDMDILTEYATGGGKLLVMGQDLASVFASTNTDTESFLFNFVLGGGWLQDSISDDVLPPGNEPGALPELPIIPSAYAPPAFGDLTLDLGATAPEEIILSGANEVPPVSTTASGTAEFGYVVSDDTLNYAIYLTTVDPMTVTAAHIHTGTVGVNGPPLYPTFPFTAPVYFTDTLSWTGSVVIDPEHVDELFNEGLYLNIHSEEHPAGELRGQVEVAILGDGAENQYYIDEIAHRPDLRAPDPYDLVPGYTPLLRYPGDDLVIDGMVTMAHRDQPSLERPGVSYLGRSIYTSFGLEGVNNGLDTTSRADLLWTFWAWLHDEPTGTIADVSTSNVSGLNRFEASVTSNITGTTGYTYRWDFGDGSDYTEPYASPIAGHIYDTCGTYTVRVEATDTWGNTTILSEDMDVEYCLQGYTIYLPLVFRNY